MNIIICLDDNNGMLFNKRRQSSDIKIREDIKSYLTDKPLFMNEYSKKQFDNGIGICVFSDFLSEAKDGDFCFVETEDITPYIEKVNKIIIYKWNRVYPADFKFDTKLLNGFSKTEDFEFEGNSHQKITREIYCK